MRQRTGAGAGAAPRSGPPLRRRQGLPAAAVFAGAIMYGGGGGAAAAFPACLFVSSPRPFVSFANHGASTNVNHRCNGRRVGSSFRQESQLYWLIGGNDNDNNPDNDKDKKTTDDNKDGTPRQLENDDDDVRTTAGRERREEERRRLERKKDVVIGKTSAIPGATNFNLDPDATRRQYLEQANSVESEIYLETQRGLEMLKMFQLEEASLAFDRVYQLKPNAYLWQAGLVHYYLDDYVEAARLFAQNAQISERRFGTCASEERIWHDVCQLKLQSERERKAKQGVRVDKTLFISPMPDEPTDGSITTETRKVVGIARDMFRAAVSKDGVNLAIYKTQLRSICGEEVVGPDIKMWKLSSWFYLGLYFDATGDDDESKACMKMAIRHSSALANDLMHALPVLHMSKRDWYDDEQVSFSPSAPTTTTTTNDNSIPSYLPSSTTVSPSVAKSMWESILQIQSSQLQAALRERSLRTSGSKRELQERLFYALLEDDAIVKP